MAKDDKYKNLPRIDYSNEFAVILYQIDDDIANDLMQIDGVTNQLGITKVDISEKDWHLDITIDGEVQTGKVGSFIREMFPGYYKKREITQFVVNYNRLKNGEDKLPDVTVKSDPIDIPDFVYDPSNVKNTFISLVTSTYPHPHEEGVMQFMPNDLTKDEFGNYYKIIGNSETMFTAHLDTADRGEPKKTRLFIGGKPDSTYGGYSGWGWGAPEFDRDPSWADDEYIFTDGSTVLGADDKSGVTVMLYMMHHNVPGIYYFFIGEERGGIGSHALAMRYNEFEHLKGIKRCVSFDRRNEHSVITEQMGQCCSDEFGRALCDELGKSGLKMGLDPGGIFTDSASFTDLIPECTNVSVGYMHEHTGDEYQNITYLDRLAKACVNVDWEKLPTVRRIGFDEYLINKYKGFLIDLRDSDFTLDKKFKSRYGSSYIVIDMENPDIDEVYTNMRILDDLFNKHNMDPSITFDYENIKIELV